MRQFFQTNLVKWIIGVMLPILAGAAGWVFQMERRVAAIEIHQQQMSESLVIIGNDIHEIRNLIVDEIRKK